MKHLAAVSVALAVVLAAACAGDGSRCAALPAGGRYCLQATADVPPFDVQQKVDVAFGGRTDTIIAQVETDSLGMRFVGTTPFGQKLVQLSFDNDRVTVEAAQMKGLDPVLLLALVQAAPAAMIFIPFPTPPQWPRLRRCTAWPGLFSGHAPSTHTSA